MLLMYFDGRIAEMQCEHDDKIAELQDSLILVQIEVKMLKRTALPASPRSQHGDTQRGGTGTERLVIYTGNSQN